MNSDEETITGLTAAATEPTAAWPQEGREDPRLRAKGQSSRSGRGCFHCGAPCPQSAPARDEKTFCCHGCLMVFELLMDHGLEDFYKLAEAAGPRVNESKQEGQFTYLDEPGVRDQLVDFTDARLTRVTFHVPAIHCVACVWLLENLFRFKPGLGESRVDFPRKEVAICFEPPHVKLSEVAALLASLGYEPELKFADLDRQPPGRAHRRLWLQAGTAGFAFGNTMLFSIASYVGWDAFSGPVLRRLVGVISLALAVPVVTYSALDYWRSAWSSLRQRLLNLDVPIAAGIAALFLQSCYEILSGHGDGYLDSLTGLIFFLLCGRIFQQKTYDRLAFDRDYKSFFPLAVTRLRRSVGEDVPGNRAPGVEEHISLSDLSVGDRLLIRSGELIPADARLVEGPARIDYSFVTGESEALEKEANSYLYAGGRQTGAAIEVEIVKPLAQSYLKSLWNQEAFRKDRPGALNVITNTYSQRFTKMVILVALGAAVVWAFVNPAVALKAFTSVLIVACPCALALAAPFALGTAQRILAHYGVFLKNPYVIETLAEVDAVVLDKTGTLTMANAESVRWQGTPLNQAEQQWLSSMTRHSTHPLVVSIGEALSGTHQVGSVQSFLELPGCGIAGVVAGKEIQMGKETWLESRSVRLPMERPCSPEDAPSTVHIAINGQYRGFYSVGSAVRTGMAQLIGQLVNNYELAMLSGDNDKDQERLRLLFGESAHLHFNQSPLDKLSFIRHLQEQDKTVMMVGDGLNDAGALKQSDVGMAVVENMSAFSPASDVIIAAGRVAVIGNVLRFAKQSLGVVRGAFVISALYNLIGIVIAASGHLSPVVCAILMPVSSVTVVAFACGMTVWLGRRLEALETPMSRRAARPAKETISRREAVAPAV